MSGMNNLRFIRIIRISSLKCFISFLTEMNDMCVYSSNLIWTEILGDISLFYEAANGRFYTSSTGNGAIKGNGGMSVSLGFHLRCRL